MTDQKEKMLSRLKTDLLEATGITDVTADEIINSEPIFGPEGNLSLDSLDALELVVLLKKKLNIKLKEKASSTVLFDNFDTLGDFIMKEAEPSVLEEYIKN